MANGGPDTDPPCHRVFISQARNANARKCRGITAVIDFSGVSHFDYGVRSPRLVMRRNNDVAHAILLTRVIHMITLEPGRDRREHGDSLL